MIKKYGLLGLGVILFAVGMIFPLSPMVRLAVFIVAWLLFGGKIVLQAIRNIGHGKVFDCMRRTEGSETNSLPKQEPALLGGVLDENFLMSVATVGAFAIGEYPEGAAVMLFYRIGEAFQDTAVNKSLNSISALMDLRPDFANVKRNGEMVQVSPDAVKPGDTIVVRPGEKIPLDGIVAEGCSALDTSALTGEAMPRDVGPGSEVLSGCINKNALLTVTVTKEFADSTVSKIVELVRNTESRKAPVENFISRFARYYTPAVVFAALALAVLPPLFISGAEFSEWVRRALVFLVVSCPCALVISIPLTFFAGIGAASRKGILVKGGNYLSALNDIETVVFDKTGTLTKGQFAVNEIRGENGISRDDLLYYAAAAESSSTHPIAQSIVQAYGKTIDVANITSVQEIAGKGIQAVINGKTVLAGNAGFFEDRGVVIPPGIAISPASENSMREFAGATVVYVAIDGVYAGCFIIADEPKPNAQQAIAELKAAGVRRIVMLSGDNHAVVERIGTVLGVDELYGELLPHQKVERLETLQKETTAGKKLAFVGDGINDAPALVRSDIGIAMGGLGSDAAIEAADIVLMTDEPLKLASALAIAQKTKNIVWQNIIFALGVKAVILTLGAIGIATMWEAVFGDVGVALIAVANAMRMMRGKREK